MPTAFVKGDLFGASGLDALAHGCNCAGAMGEGIAIEFALGESTYVELVVLRSTSRRPREGTWRQRRWGL